MVQRVQRVVVSPPTAVKNIYLFAADLILYLSCLTLAGRNSAVSG